MTSEATKRARVCACASCVMDATSEIAQWHAQVNHMVIVLNEKHRRQFVGLLARQLGHGGIKCLAAVTGLSRNTIARGQQEIQAGDFSLRVRACGGGRQAVEKNA